MSAILTSHELDALFSKGCQIPGCKHENHHPDGLFFNSRCHPKMGVSMLYKNRRIRLQCRECGKYICDVAVADPVDRSVALQKAIALLEYLRDNIEMDEDQKKIDDFLKEPWL